MQNFSLVVIISKLTLRCNSRRKIIPQGSRGLRTSLACRRSRPRRCIPQRWLVLESRGSEIFAADASRSALFGFEIVRPPDRLEIILRIDETAIHLARARPRKSETHSSGETKESRGRLHLPCRRQFCNFSKSQPLPLPLPLTVPSLKSASRFHRIYRRLRLRYRDFLLPSLSQPSACLLVFLYITHMMQFTCVSSASEAVQVSPIFHPLKFF